VKNFFALGSIFVEIILFFFSVPTVIALNDCSVTVNYSPTYSPLCADTSSTYQTTFSNITVNDSLYTGETYVSTTADTSPIHEPKDVNNGVMAPISLGPFPAGIQTIFLKVYPSGEFICKASIEIISDSCAISQTKCIAPLPPAFDTCPATNPYYCYLDPIGMTQLTCCVDKAMCDGVTLPTPSPGPTISVYDPTCNSGSGIYGYIGVKSGLGCLPTDPQTFINMVTPWAIGIGAGIAFLLGLYGALMIVISAGDPEKMQAGRELITSAVAGLLLIVFAVFILRIIGVDVLKLF